MRILIISFFNDWITHLGVELELAQRHLDDGDEVEFLGCDGCIEACRANKGGDRRVCGVCRHQRLRGIQALTGHVEEHRLGNYADSAILEQADRLSAPIRTAAEAKAFRHDGYDLGWGALSSTIQEARDPLCESDEAKALLSRFTKTAVISYESVRSFLRKHPSFDKVYIFNGRFASTRGAFRACQETGGMDVVLHERGSSPLKYSLFENDLLHTREMWRRRIDETWDAELDLAKRARLGSLFYEERRSGTSVGWKSFTDLHEQGALPPDWDSARTNIVIFNSSEDEFAAIGDEWKNHVYEMQNVGVRRIVADALERYPDVRFYLRMHPNLIGVSNEDVNQLHRIESANFHLIEPDSSISTYALLDAADKVISFGSSVGIEATFWNKPSIMAGHSFYEHLGSVYCPQNHEEVMALIGQNLEPCPKEGALKYGFHLRTFGTDFKFWKADGFDDGSLNGRVLKCGELHAGRRGALLLARFFSSRSIPMRAANRLFDAYDKFRSFSNTQRPNEYET